MSTWTVASRRPDVAEEFATRYNAELFYTDYDLLFDDPELDAVVITIILPAGVYLMTLEGKNENAALTGDLDILQNLTITGAGSGSTILDGNQLDRLIEIFSPA